MSVRVIFTYDPKDRDIDTADPTGLTQEAYEELFDSLNLQFSPDDLDVNQVEAA